MKKLLYVTLSGVCLFLASCANVAETNVQMKGSDILSVKYDSIYHAASRHAEKVEIRYAKGLKVDYRADGVHVFITNPDPSVKRSQPTELILPAKPDAQKKKRMMCTTALQLGNFEVLGIEERIVAINSLKNVFSDRMIAQTASGKTVRVGKEGVFDIEAVIAAKPDYIFVSASKFGGFEALKDCGIPLVPHHGYKETDPLGQAEWIKLIGLLTGETRRANAVFSYIESEYLSLKQKVSDSMSGVASSSWPTILSGRQVRDGWYTMGGKSYMAQIFKDAGAHYIMADMDNTGGTTLDFESVYAKGINADFWQIDGTFDDHYSLSDLAVEDARYMDIAAYKKGHVLFCNFSKTPYRELAGVSPHLLLADFVRAFHPELLKGHKPVFYDFIK